MPVSRPARAAASWPSTEASTCGLIAAAAASPNRAVPSRVSWPAFSSTVILPMRASIEAGRAALDGPSAQPSGERPSSASAPAPARKPRREKREAGGAADVVRDMAARVVNGYSDLSGGRAHCKVPAPDSRPGGCEVWGNARMRTRRRMQANRVRDPDRKAASRDPCTIHAQARETRAGNKKPRLRRGLCFRMWCPGEDSNLHEVASAST